uniref:Pentatricopeptide repeat-containing protein At3g15130 family n=1 Tax=Cajanus cajan TaxID=3821 RepID=A0A151TSX5_CAJCA|nr:Putative pentatricopeptide repeat-containing protein At3g15130 family [Cajanus cajan]
MNEGRLLSKILNKCSNRRLLDQGKQVHGVVEKLRLGRDLILNNDLIDMYAKCGTVDFACKVFDRMPQRNVVSWTALMCGYLQNGDAKTSLVLFVKMGLRNVISWNAMIAVYTHEGNGALVDLYVKCRRVAEARRVFDRIEEKSVMSWSTLILGYAHEDDLAEAMDLFRELRESRQRMDGFVLSSLIGVFADLALVEQGKQMHGYTIKVPYGLLEMSVANSVLDMYMKCGLTDEADALFREMPARNVVSWTVMITGYGKHGMGNKAVELFNGMQVNGIEPDTKDLIEKMPLKPNVGIWQTLLSVCRMHGDVELGKQVGEVLLRLDGNNPANYVLMSNIYADAGYWKESEKMREISKRKGLKKEAGRSWVEIAKEIHIFYNGDGMHPLIGEILQVLKEMEKRVKEEMGYVHSVNFALHDVEEESKVESLRIHSEKLAIGLVLVRGGLKAERVIRIFKNLRVCGDCHTFIKGLSKVLKIVFVVRDANRFHRFENGLCSCGDYW